MNNLRHQYTINIMNIVKYGTIVLGLAAGVASFKHGAQNSTRAGEDRLAFVPKDERWSSGKPGFSALGGAFLGAIGAALIGRRELNDIAGFAEIGAGLGLIGEEVARQHDVSLNQKRKGLDDIQNQGQEGTTPVQAAREISPETGPLRPKITDRTRQTAVTSSSVTAASRVARPQERRDERRGRL